MSKSTIRRTIFGLSALAGSSALLVLGVAFALICISFAFAQTIPASSNSLAIAQVIVTPQVTQAWPESGGRGQYVTLQGSGFGSTPGSVSFSEGGQSTLAAVDFPKECTGLWWRDGYVIVKVPDSLAPGAYQMKLAKPDGSTSNTVSFQVTSNPPSLGICGVNPDNGAAGTPMSIYGEGFGATQGRVSIGTTDATLANNGWNDTFISIVAPVSGLLSGKLRVIDATQTLSNPIFFTAGRCVAGQCGAGETCCLDGACRLSGSCQNKEAICQYGWSITTASLADIGQSCLVNTDCRSQTCGANKKCIQGTKDINASCQFDQECRASLFCQNGSCVSKYKTTGESCTSNSECGSGNCTNNICQAGTLALGAACTTGDQCQSSTCTNSLCSQAPRALTATNMSPSGSTVGSLGC